MHSDWLFLKMPSSWKHQVIPQNRISIHEKKLLPRSLFIYVHSVTIRFKCHSVLPVGLSQFIDVQHSTVKLHHLTSLTYVTVFAFTVAAWSYCTNCLTAKVWQWLFSWEQNFSRACFQLFTPLVINASSTRRSATLSAIRRNSSALQQLRHKTPGTSGLTNIQ